MVNLSSHGGKGKRDRGKAEQQRHGENRRWLIVTCLLGERESDSKGDQWQQRKEKTRMLGWVWRATPSDIFLCGSFHWLIFCRHNTQRGRQSQVVAVTFKSSAIYRIVYQILCLHLCSKPPLHLWPLE